MKRFIAPIILLFAVSCASLPAKQQGVISLRSVDQALSAAQDYERANHQLLGLDQPAAPALWSLCPPSFLKLPSNPTAHQAISCLFARAFDDEQKAAFVLQAWHAGDPVPRDMEMLQGDVDGILGAARSLTDRVSQRRFLDEAQQAFDSLMAVYRLMGYK